jgi:ATP-dependent RNA helicase SUPV3L1/SUV3
LSQADRARLSKLGVRFGVRHIYLGAMLHPRAVALRARLWAIRHRTPPLGAPATPCPAFRVEDGGSKEMAEAAGFEALAAAWVRIDVVERLAAGLRSRARTAPFTLDLELLRLTGLAEADLVPVVEALGYARDAEGRFHRCLAARRRQTRRPRGALPATPFAALGRIRAGR